MELYRKVLRELKYKINNNIKLEIKAKPMMQKT